MATVEHFSKFKVENFKRFEKFEMDNLGQFNVIVGDNNVGKTSVLEALMIEDDWKYFFNNLNIALTRYKNFGNLREWFLLQYFNKHSKLTEQAMRFQLLDFNGRDRDFFLSFDFKSNQYTWKIDNANPVFVDKTNNFFHNNTPLLPFSLNYEHDLADYYALNIQTHNTKKEQLIQDMRAIIPTIKYIEPNPAYVNGQSILTISLSDKDANLPLGTYGDGVIKLFRILIAMQIFSQKRLMIDEIGIGIHYGRMKDFWKTVIHSARNNNVQLFATTHSDECIGSFAQVLEEEGQDFQKDARIIHLEEIEKTKQVKAYTYPFNEFDHALNVGNELR